MPPWYVPRLLSLAVSSIDKRVWVNSRSCYVHHFNSIVLLVNCPLFQYSNPHSSLRLGCAGLPFVHAWNSGAGGFLVWWVRLTAFSLSTADYCHQRHHTTTTEGDLQWCIHSLWIDGHWSPSNHPFPSRSDRWSLSGWHHALFNVAYKILFLSMQLNIG